jgi:hypothetical protein
MAKKVSKNIENNNDKTAGVAIAALILGILTIVIGWIPVLGQGLGIAAIVCGIIGINKANNEKMAGKGIAIAGIVLGVIGLLISLIVLIGIIAYFGVLSPSNLAP